jgi:hypothetical protein
MRTTARTRTRTASLLSAAALTALPLIVDSGSAHAADTSARRAESRVADSAPAGGSSAQYVPLIAEPALAYLETTAQAFVKDTYGDYYGPVTVTSRCTAFSVSSNGYLVTAGHCVDAAPGSDTHADLVKEAARLAAEEGRYASSGIPLTQQEIFDQLALPFWVVEGATAGSPPVVDVMVQPHGEGDMFPAVVREVTSFKEGDTAVLKINVTGLVTVSVVGKLPVKRRSDLLGTPLLAQPVRHELPQHPVARQRAAPGTGPTSHRQPVGGKRPVLSTVRVTDSAQLPADRGRATTQLGGDRPHPKALPVQVRDPGPLVLGDVARRDLPRSCADHSRIVQPPAAAAGDPPAVSPPLPGSRVHPHDPARLRARNTPRDQTARTAHASPSAAPPLVDRDPSRLPTSSDIATITGVRWRVNGPRIRIAVLDRGVGVRLPTGLWNSILLTPC